MLVGQVGSSGTALVHTALFLIYYTLGWTLSALLSPTFFGRYTGLLSFGYPSFIVHGNFSYFILTLNILYT